MSETRNQLVNLSILTIIKFFLVILLIIFLYLIRDLILILFVSLILSSALSPGVDFLTKKKIPRTLSILFFFLLFIAIAIAIITLIVPVLISQFSELLQSGPVYYNKLQTLFSSLQTFSAEHGQSDNFLKALNIFQSEISASAGGFIGSLFQFFGGIFSFVITLVLTFYLLLEENAIKRASQMIVPYKYHVFLSELINKIQKKISSWLKGQIVLSLLIGFFVFISMMTLGVKYALVLALLAFLGEFIPYLGPVLAALPAILVAFIDSPLKALFVFIIFVIIQQVENHILVPKIMQKAVGLNPLISILALLIGARLGGVMGVILAIPITTAIIVIISEIFTKDIKTDQISS
ncbi:hypothetical protein A2300_01690 [Candidatus Falkowbacteria bacterium RIFOXYB2_FULL_35_7]|uniref:AI-2E family transporter n=1 Tax=Candidatus Falkowbacteria bacterium RIFOXYC2_FULL_36_12 TaxID=1798002 RepID=A0A1F5SZY3_9BACT|nr:MAG: hypothetical protein A2300_01690 [Candidatus Falkowbacteria bacterium RIFOXYB2_FULL_35_7]OGF31781.1 MAG: hypothetical protein A2478_04830 [Candidatus Falkowbacteria bacterium RIFOXYC2_FULL_36_12]